MADARPWMTFPLRKPGMPGLPGVKTGPGRFFHLLIRRVPVVAALGGIVLTASCLPVRNPDLLRSEFHPRPEEPAVSFRILIQVGSAEDPTGWEGLCRLTWTMLAEGSSRLHPAEEIRGILASTAARISMRVGKETAVFSAAVQNIHLRPFYAIFKEMLLDPGFRPDDFTRLKAGQLETAGRSAADSGNDRLGEELLESMIFTGDPRNHPGAGSVESVQGLTLDGVKAFYREHFVQGNIIIGLAGGYPDDFPAEIEADFGKLPPGFTPAPDPPPARFPQGLEFLLAEMETPDTTIVFGFPVRRLKSDREYFALAFAAAHLGEPRPEIPNPAFAGRRPYFSICLRSVPNDDRHFAVRRMLLGLHRLAEEGFSEERFQAVKTRLLSLGSIDPASGTSFERPALSAENLAALTRREVNRTLRKNIRATNVFIAVVTSNAEALKEALILNTPSPRRSVESESAKETAEENRRIENLRLDIDPERIRILPAGDFRQKPEPPESDGTAKILFRLNSSLT